MVVYIQPKDLQPVADKIKDTILSRTAEGISAEQKPFAKLRTGEKSVLEESGKLMNSLKTSVEKDLRIVVYTEVPYAPHVHETRPTYDSWEYGSKGNDIEASDEIWHISVDQAHKIINEAIRRGEL